MKEVMYMIKKVFTFVMLILVVIGIAIGIYFSMSSTRKETVKQEKSDNIFSILQTKQVEVNKFFTYGR